MTLSAQLKWITNLDEFKKAVLESTDGLVAHTSTVDKLTRSLQGQGLIASVHNYAAAVEKAGGVERLTAASKERINALAEKALLQYRALGQEAPAHIQRLADATRSAVVPVNQLAIETEKLAQKLGGGGAAQSAQAYVAAVERVGGASKLTEAEQRQVNAALTEAIAKYRALGQQAPADMLALEKATRDVEVVNTRTWADVGAGMQKFGQGAKTVGIGLMGAITAPILGVAGAAIKLGMDAVESENLVSVSFGDMKSKADDWSKQLSKSLGLNEFELRKQAGTLFNMTTSMGLSKDAAFGMSTGVAQLAADMSSFRNIPMEEALTKIRSGLVGEAEPLKAIGILVDDATVKTYAYANGIAKQGTELTQQQKVMARWGVILQQTANDQGDLARTADSPTNKLRIMKTRIEEAATALGVELIPMVSKVIGWFSGLVPYVQGVVKWFGDLPEPVKVGVVVLAAIAAAAGPVIFVFGTLASSIGSLVALLGTAGLVGALGSAGTALAVAGAAIAPFALPLAALGGALIYTITKTTELRNDFKKLEDASRLVGKAILDVGVATAILGAHEAGKRGERLTDVQITLDMAKAYKAGQDAVSKAADAAQQHAAATEQNRTAMVGGVVTIEAFATATTSATDPLAKMKAQAIALKADALAPLSSEHAKLVLAFAKGGDSAADIAKRFSTVAETANISEAAIKKTIEAHKKSASASEAHAKALTDVNQKIADATRDTGTLTDAQKLSIASYVTLGLSTQDIGLKLGVSEVAVKNLTEAQKRSADAAIEWGKVEVEWAKQAEKAVVNMTKEAIAGANAEAKARGAAQSQMLATFTEYSEKNKGLALSEKDFKIRQIDLAEARVIASLGTQRGEHDVFYGMSRAQIEAYYQHQIDLANSTQSTIVERMRSAGVATRADLVLTADAARLNFDQMQASGEFSALAIQAAWQKWYDADQAARGLMVSGFVADLGLIGGLFTQIGQAGSDAFNTIAGAVGNAITGLQQGKKAHEELLKVQQQYKDGQVSGTTVAMAYGSVIVSGAQDMMRSTESTSKANAALGGMRSGMVTGMAIAGPYGAAVGAAAGAIIGLVRAAGAGRDAVKSFAESFGGFDALHLKLQTLGALGEEMWIKLTQGVDKGNPKAAGDAIAAIKKALEGSEASLNKMIAAALTGGPAISASMQPFIEDLIRAGKLTEENVNLLLGLPAAGVPSIEEVQAAAERYGITLDDLGQKAKQLEITKTAAQIVADWTTLIAVTENVGLVMDKMRPKVQALVDDAIKFGLTLPESMRPMIDQMIRAGILTDGTGKKMLDMSKLNFAEPIEKSIQKLIEKMAELIAKFTALDGKKVTTTVVTHRTHTGDDPDPADPAADPDPTGASGVATGGLVGRGRIIPFPFRRGGFVDFRPQGTDTVPALLTPGEIVLNAAQQKSVAGTIGGGGSVSISVHVDARGAAKNDAEAIAKKVAAEILTTLRREKRLNVA